MQQWNKICENSTKTKFFFRCRIWWSKIYFIRNNFWKFVIEWILSFVDSNPQCYELSCCGSCGLDFFSFIQIALARLSLWNSKVRLFWQGHKNLRNLPYGFDIYLVSVKNMRKIAQIFVAFSEKLNFKYFYWEIKLIECNQNENHI